MGDFLASFHFSFPFVCLPLFFFFFFFFWLWLHPWHVKVPGARIDPSCSFNLHSAVAMLDPLTHCARPGIEPLPP